MDASLYFALAKNLLPLSKYRCARTLGSRVQPASTSNASGRHIKDLQLFIYPLVHHKKRPPAMHQSPGPRGAIALEIVAVISASLGGGLPPLPSVDHAGVANAIVKRPLLSIEAGDDVAD